MAFEDIKIIIKKNGEIWVDLGNLEPQRIKHYKDLFEEAIGPVKGELTGADGGGGYGGVPLTGRLETGEEEEEKEQIKNGR
jgi:hypothetical protein